jgi:cytidylate kinase
MNITKKQIITIGGRPGSGKSTTAKAISEQLGFMHFSSGDLFRAVSREHGQDVLQSNLEAEKEDGVSKIDQLVDQRLRDIGTNDNQLVIDSRMAWHWMPYSFRVFLDLDLETAAHRILGGMTPERIQAEHISEDPAEYAESLNERLESEARRYKKMYQINPYDLTNYDLVVDTKVNSVEEVVAQIVEVYTSWATDLQASE